MKMLALRAHCVKQIVNERGALNVCLDAHNQRPLVAHRRLHIAQATDEMHLPDLEGGAA